MLFPKFRPLQTGLSLSLAVFIICLSVQLTLLFKPLFYFDIEYLNIEEESNLSRETIIENYDYMIDYLLNPMPQTFHLPSLDYSEHGRIHFQDVKRIFTFNYILLVITGIISIIGFYFSVRNRDFYFLKTAAAALILFTIIPLVAFAVDFNTVFIIFHELFFSNDYWIFDARTDPVITILPETFFLHAALLILGLILLGIILLSASYKGLSKKYNR
ncbi:TIGR01906 family membrane protein [Sporolactobacillus sp. THM7-7]|nr:TIGR01906 family membrane protein [Sporolactobacillus sp. THM7-7]